MSSERAQVLDASAWTPDETSPRTCNNCDRHIDHLLRRVFGDVDGQVDRCYHCATQREMSGGAAAGRDIEEARSHSPPRGGGQGGESL